MRRFESSRGHELVSPAAIFIAYPATKPSAQSNRTLAPFLFTGGAIFNGILASLAVSAAALFLIGWYKAKKTVGRPARSGAQMLLIGIVSALAGFGIAYLVGAPGG